MIVSLVYWPFSESARTIRYHHGPQLFSTFTAMDHHLLAIAIGVHQIIKLFGDHLLQQSIVDVVWFILLEPSAPFFCFFRLNSLIDSTVFWLEAKTGSNPHEWFGELGLHRHWTGADGNELLGKKKTCGWFSIRESEQSGPSCLGVPKWCISSVGFAQWFDRRSSKSPPTWNLITDNRSYVYIAVFKDLND